MMNNKTGVVMIFSICFVFMSSCGEFGASAAEESFEDADKPAYVQDIPGDFWLCKPWNYENLANSGRRYPLFVYLHGSGSQGLPSSLPCFNGGEDQKLYPSFVYEPHASGSWDNAKLIAQIEALKAAYRIDVNRVYLMGYSMGASGSYALANAYYNSKKAIFAGIVRMSGQSQSELAPAIADKASVWYHIGLADDAARVTVARDSWDFLKNYPGNAGALETTAAVPLASYPGTTRTLTRGSIEIVKYTEYDAPVGHGISNFPLTDPAVLKWLFSQSLSRR